MLLFFLGCAYLLLLLLGRAYLLLLLPGSAYLLLHLPGRAYLLLLFLGRAYLLLLFLGRAYPLLLFLGRAYLLLFFPGRAYLLLLFLGCDYLLLPCLERSHRLLYILCNCSAFCLLRHSSYPLWGRCFAYRCFTSRCFSGCRFSGRRLFICCLFNSRLLGFFRLRACVDADTHRRYIDFNGIVLFIPFQLPGCLDTPVDPAFSAKVFGISVEYLLILAVEGHAHTEFLMLHVVKIADKEKGFLTLPALSQEYNHALILVTAVNPLKTIGIIIHLIQSRMLTVQSVKRLHIILHVLVDRILQKSPLQGRALIPFSRLGVFLAHEQQLLAGMPHHKGIGSPQVLGLLFQGLTRHLANHGTLAVNHLIVGEYQHKILAVGIQHGKCQLPIIVFPEKRVAPHVVGKIIHPAHVPLIVKSQAALFRIACNHWPCSGLLRDDDRAVLSALEYGIQMLQELHCLQILIASVYIRHPFTVILPIVQIEHGSYRIHPDSVRMVLVRPEQRIGNQKIGYAGTAVIVYQSAPMGMGALPGVHVFIDAGAVKHSHSIGIPWEMGRHPVKYDADSLSMHIVHKVHEILRSTVTAGRGIIPCYLITPGFIQRMLHHRHELHMGVSHILYVFRQPWGQLPVIIKFGTRQVLSCLIPDSLLTDPGAQMDLIYVHGLVLCICLCPLIHP